MRTKVKQPASPRSVDRSPPESVTAVAFKDEDIRARAYEIYLRRVQDGEAGDAQADWLRAERELKEQETAVSARGGALRSGDPE
jgi:hypothetical protein